MKTTPRNHERNEMKLKVKYQFTNQEDYFGWIQNSVIVKGKHGFTRNYDEAHLYEHSSEEEIYEKLIALKHEWTSANHKYSDLKWVALIEGGITIELPETLDPKTDHWEEWDAA